MPRKPKPRAKRKTNAELLVSVQRKLRKLDAQTAGYLEDRLVLLRAFEETVLRERVLAPKPRSRTQLAIDSRLGGPQAAQLERKMLVRVLAILHNAPSPGGPTA